MENILSVHEVDTKDNRLCCFMYWQTFKKDFTAFQTHYGFFKLVNTPKRQPFAIYLN
jgi:hypothetical protein